MPTEKMLNKVKRVTCSTTAEEAEEEASVRADTTEEIEEEEEDLASDLGSSGGLPDGSGEESDTNGPATAPIRYTFVLGEDKVNYGLDEYTTIAQMLHWIGFKELAKRQLIMDDGLDTFMAFRHLSDKDVHDMANDFANRTNADKITFGIGRRKYLLAMTHYITDHYRISTKPDIYLMNQPKFIAYLNTALL